MESARSLSTTGKRKQCSCEGMRLGSGCKCAQTKWLRARFEAVTGQDPFSLKQQSADDKLLELIVSASTDEDIVGYSPRLSDSDDVGQEDDQDLDVFCRTGDTIDDGRAPLLG